MSSPSAPKTPIRRAPKRRRSPTADDGLSSSPTPVAGPSRPRRNSSPHSTLPPSSSPPRFDPDSSEGEGERDEVVRDLQDEIADDDGEGEDLYGETLEEYALSFPSCTSFHYSHDYA